MQESSAYHYIDTWEKNPSISQVIQGPFCSDKEYLWADDMTGGRGG